MKTALFALILASAIVVLPEIRAQEFLLPDPEIEAGADLPALEFTDDNGRRHSLTELRGLPVILLPIYTRCRSTCSLAAERLKRELLRARERLGRFQILIFSFDPSDTAGTLKAFRQAHALPADWLLGSSTAAEIDRLTKAIGLRLGRARGGNSTDFVHADVVVFLSPRLRVATFLPGDSGGASIATALEQARADGNWLRSLVPSVLIVAIFGAILCVFLAAHLWASGSS